jgi:hypothetical protein
MEILLTFTVLKIANMEDKIKKYVLQELQRQTIESIECK